MFTVLAATLPTMDSTDLTPEQAAQLPDRVRPMLAYDNALHQRIERRHFPPQDQLKQRVEAAYDALHRLSIELHYMSCDGGVGR